MAEELQKIIQKLEAQLKALDPGDREIIEPLIAKQIDHLSIKIDHVMKMGIATWFNQPDDPEDSVIPTPSAQGVETKCPRCGRKIKLVSAE